MALGFTDFSAGQQLTADLMDGVVRQTVMTFASESARDTALSGVLDEGMVAHCISEDTDTWYDGSAWRYWRKPPATYTPSSTSIPAVGNGTLLAHFSIEMNRCTAWGQFTLGTTSSYGGTPFTFQVALPTGFTAAAFPTPTGSAQLIDASGNLFYPALSQVSGGNIEVLNAGGPQSDDYLLATASPFTWTNGDIVAWQVSYPIA